MINGITSAKLLTGEEETNVDMQEHVIHSLSLLFPIYIIVWWHGSCSVIFATAVGQCKYNYRKCHKGDFLLQIMNKNDGE
jgi:hypothetical protein